MTTKPIAQVRLGRRVGSIKVSALTMGAVAGLLAVMVGAFFEVYPPEAYGLCMACHARDLVNWSTNHLFSTNLVVAEASTVFPLLTTVGVLVGAFVGAITSGEFRWKTFDNPLKTFVYGVLVMNFALLAAGCSFRLALRAAGGEPLGLAGFATFIAGAILATLWLKREALR